MFVRLTRFLNRVGTLVKLEFHHADPLTLRLFLSAVNRYLSIRSRENLRMANLIYPKTKIDKHQHLIHPMRVHSLLPDFELEDVWQAPVSLAASHSLQLFMDQFTKTNAEVVNRGMSGLLFKFRLLIGRWLTWDEKLLQDYLVPGSIRCRYAEQENLAYNDLPHPGSGSFVPVYKLENEFLSEINNSIVHAALHVSRVTSGKGKWTIHIAVYVKPKGWFGKWYMMFIKPFRLWIVYPSLMRASGKNWNAYLKDTPGQTGIE